MRMEIKVGGSKPHQSFDVRFIMRKLFLYENFDGDLPMSQGHEVAFQEWYVLLCLTSDLVGSHLFRIQNLNEKLASPWYV